MDKPTQWSVHRSHVSRKNPTSGHTVGPVVTVCLGQWVLPSETERGKARMRQQKGNLARPASGSRGCEGASLCLLHSTLAASSLPNMLKEMVLFVLSVVLVSFSRDWELEPVTLCEGLTRLPLCDHRHPTDQIKYLGSGGWVGAGGWLSTIPGSLSSYSIISPLQLQSIEKVGPSLRSEEQLEEMAGREETRRGVSCPPLQSGSGLGGASRSAGVPRSALG